MKFMILDFLFQKGQHQNNWQNLIKIYRLGTGVLSLLIS